MALGTLQIAALILSVLIIIKLLVVSVKPKAWFNLAKKMYSQPVILALVELVLAALLLYYLLMQLTIVQIMAVIAFGALLTGMTFAIYGKETLDWAKRLLGEKTLLRRAWLPIIVWLVLAVWTLYVLFA